MNQQDIEQVVKAVLLKMQSSDTPPAAVHEMGVFASLDDAVAAAKVAQQGLKSVAMRQLAIAAIREAGEKHARDLAELAVSETGMGRVEDKFAKNVAQARGTPGVECLSPQVLTGDNGLTLIENAPWGVVASVTPSTNPAATVINNAISLIAAGNSVIFAPHPAAKKVSQRAITLLNQAIVAAGGPLILCVRQKHPFSRSIEINDCTIPGIKDPPPRRLAPSPPRWRHVKNCRAVYQRNLWTGYRNAQSGSARDHR